MLPQSNNGLPENAQQMRRFLTSAPAKTGCIWKKRFDHISTEVILTV
jgi:hypothetical protein